MTGRKFEKTKISLLADPPVFEVLSRDNTLGSLLFGKKVMRILHRVYYPKISVVHFACWVLPVLPSVIFYWAADNLTSNILFLVVGILSITHQLLQSLRMNIRIARMAIRDFETIYVFCHLCVESLSLCHTLEYSPKGAFFVFACFCAQINCILLDAFPRSSRQYTNAFRSILKLKHKYTDAPQIHKQDRTFPRWNPSHSKTAENLLQDEDCVTNMQHLAHALNNFSRPPPGLRFLSTLSFRIQYCWCSMNRGNAAACFFGFVTKVTVYILVVQGIVPSNVELTINFFGMQWTLLDLFRVSCASSIIIYLKRLTLLIAYPFQLTTITKSGLLIPLMQPWSDLMSSDDRRTFKHYLHMSETQVNELSTPSDDDILAKWRLIKRNQHLQPSQREDDHNCERPLLLPLNSQRRSTESSKSPIVMMSSSGGGYLINVEKTFLKYIFPNQHEKISSRIRQYSHTSGIAWQISAILLILAIYFKQKHIHALSIIGFAVSGSVYIMFLMSCYTDILARSLQEFATIYTLFNMVSMVVLWSIYCRYFQGVGVIVCISIFFSCATGTFCDSHPVAFRKLINTLTQVRSNSQGQTFPSYEKKHADFICQIIVSKAKLLINPSLLHWRRKISWMFSPNEGQLEPLFSVHSPEETPQTDGKTPQQGLGLWQQIAARRRMSLGRPLFALLGPLSLLAFLFLLEQGDGFRDEDIHIFGMTWGSRLLMRSYTLNFIFFITRRLVLSMIRPFSVPSLHQPLYLIPLTPEIINDSYHLEQATP